MLYPYKYYTHVLVRDLMGAVLILPYHTVSVNLLKLIIFCYSCLVIKQKNRVNVPIMKYCYTLPYTQSGSCCYDDAF